MTLLPQFKRWMFADLPNDAGALSVIGWWERRRIPYNLFVGVVALVCLVLYCFFLQASVFLEHGEDLFEPMAIIIAPFVINLCYTAGWVMQLATRPLLRDRIKCVGPKLLKLGLAFSLFCVWLPAVIWFVYWCLLQMHLVQPHSDG